MKKYNNIPGAVAIGVFVACLSCACFPIPIKGNGIMTSSEKSVSPFESIHVSGSAVVVFHESQEYRVAVTVDSNLNEYIRVYSEDNVLKISTQREKRCVFTQFKVDVYCSGISNLSISGAARFECGDPIITSSFKTIISGAGKITGTIECDTFTANISGAAQIMLAGSCNDLDLSLSGAGTFAGDDFKTNNAAVNISGTANVDLWVLEHLNARVNGTGKITYRGDPKIDFTGSGLGRLERR